MMTIAPATGIQIAALIVLVNFLVAIAAKHIAIAVGWPPGFFNLLGNLIAFGVAAAVLFGFTAIRRHVVAELAKPIPANLRTEVLVVALANLTIPFGVMGALALYYIYVAPPPDLFQSLGLAGDPAAQSRSFYSVHGLVQATLLGLIVAPFLEELVYRGLLYKAWERQWGWFPAMLATSAVFGLVHPSHMASAFLGSVVYVCLLRRTGTLWAPICGHSIFNLLIAWPLLGHFVFVKDRGTVGQIESWAFELLCFAIAGAGLSTYVWMARKPWNAEFPATLVLSVRTR